MQGSQLSAEVYETSESSTASRQRLSVHVTVSEDDEWIGDFWVVFTRKRIGGEDKYVADWDSVKEHGNGIYVDEQPPFWAVEEAADELDAQYELQTFEAINSGPQDI